MATRDVALAPLLLRVGKSGYRRVQGGRTQQAHVGAAAPGAETI